MKLDWSGGPDGIFNGKKENKNRLILWWGLTGTVGIVLEISLGSKFNEWETLLIDSLPSRFSSWNRESYDTLLVEIH